jgi:hypothetical protein
MSQADNLVQATGDWQQRVGGGPKTFSSVLRNSHEYPEVEWRGSTPQPPLALRLATTTITFDDLQGRIWAFLTGVQKIEAP